MESCPRKQQLDSVKQSSFQSHTLNNVTNTLSKSATLNVTSSRFRHGEFLNADFRATMVSTTSAPTPSATTSPFYLLRDDPRELITSYFCMNSVTVFLCFFNSTSLFFCSHTARNKWQPFTWLRPDTKRQKGEGRSQFVSSAFAW